MPTMSASNDSFVGFVVLLKLWRANGLSGVNNHSKFNVLALINVKIVNSDYF